MIGRGGRVEGALEGLFLRRMGRPAYFGKIAVTFGRELIKNGGS